VLFKLEEDKIMKEDVVLVSGVMVAAVVCAWYVAHAIAGVVVHPIPTDDTCTTVTQCLMVALG
jgi:energy-converting hydrogenase Eha subunit C